MKYTHLVLLLSMLSLAGCPYMSKQPLDTGSYTDTAWLVGKWKEVKPDGGGDMYDLQKDNDTTGAMVAYEMDSVNKRSDRTHKVVFSKLGENVYVSIYDKETGPKGYEGYFIYQLRVKGKTEFELWPVKENKSISTVSALKDFLLKNEKNNDILDVNTVIKFRKL